MIIKLLILGFVGITAIQAFPSDEPLPEKQQTCSEKLAKYRDYAQKTHEKFDEYYDQLKSHKFGKQDISNNINAEEDKTKIQMAEEEIDDFKKKLEDALNRFSEGSKNLTSITDTSARLIFCKKELKWSSWLNQNLTQTATDIKKDVMNILDFLPLPQKVKEDIDRLLSRIVNFLFIIDLTKNIYKDVNALWNQAKERVEEGVKLEEVYEHNEYGELVKTQEALDKASELENRRADMEQSEINEESDRVTDNTEIQEHKAIAEEEKPTIDEEGQEPGTEPLPEPVAEPIDIPVVLPVEG